MRGPVERGGYWVWEGRIRDEGARAVEVRFAGRGGAAERTEILAATEADPPPLAWARQIHSDRWLEAREGFCGEGDALVGHERGLALSVITADCVPVLVAGPEGLAAIHAGWRGLASRLVEKTLAAWRGEPLRAWIGPAAGPCCYEVGEDVARRVAEASGAEVASPGPAGRPHLDLQRAARLQLERCGATSVEVVERCTVCDPQHLASYRRDGARAGRNLAVIWRR